MKMRSFTRSLVCASLLALVSTGVNAAEKVTLKLAHNLERSHVVHQSFEELAKEVAELVSDRMQKVADLSVPLVAEAKWGKSWYEAK